MFIYLRSFIPKYSSYEKFLKKDIIRSTVEKHNFQTTTLVYSRRNNKNEPPSPNDDRNHKNDLKPSKKHSAKLFAFVNYQSSAEKVSRPDIKPNNEISENQPIKAYTNETKQDLKQEESALIKIANLLNKLEPTKTAKELMDLTTKVPHDFKNNKLIKIDNHKIPQESTVKVVVSKKTNLIKNIEIVEDTSQPNIKFSIQDLDRQSFKTQKVKKQIEEFNFKSGNGLNIFNEQGQSSLISRTNESFIWENYNQFELNQLFVPAPLNGFEEMIELTNEGKLWNFPIDNEQGVEENEADISFDQHIFLEGYLEKFPQIDPVQQFMTLVLSGISHNGFLSLSEKTEVIQWYKNYFDEKLDTLKEAMESEKMEQEYFQRR
jgi:small subunit ribosomal protein S31